MRIWLRPDDSASSACTPADVIRPIQEQNLQAPAGQIGARPSPPGQQFTYTVQAPGRLVDRRRSSARSSSAPPTRARVVRIKDIGRVELGSEYYKSFGRLSIPRRLDGKPVTACPRRSWRSTCCPAPTSSQAAEGIYTTLEERQAVLPDGRDYMIVYDTTPAVRSLDRGDHHTLFEALILVDPRRVHLPAERARDLHPAAHHPRLAARHVHLLPAASASASTRSRCSAWCSPSASSSTTPSWSSRR